MGASLAGGVEIRNTGSCNEIAATVQYGYTYVFDEI
jgi:hypothetical protein